MKRKTVVSSLIVMAFLTFGSPAIMAQEIAYASTDTQEVQPRTDIKEWRYKVINGRLYKRLFNASTGRWETDWILVENQI